MQAALCVAPYFPILTPTKTSVSVATLSRSPPMLRSSLVSRSPAIKAINFVAYAYDTSTVDYSSMTSVFPAEACETIGGETCSAQMYPEVKIKPESGNGVPKIMPEMIDREYVDYNEPKTVFPGEACDDLGGEFCEADYQRGVY